MIEILLGERLIQLTQKLTIIGRGENCDVRINDRTISRRHCAIYISDGTARIVDGDLLTNRPSSNGVTINGKRLDFNHGQILNDGDVVELSLTISFKFFSRKITEDGDEQSTLL